MLDCYSFQNFAHIPEIKGGISGIWANSREELWSGNTVPWPKFLFPVPRLRNWACTGTRSSIRGQPQNRT